MAVIVAFLLMFVAARNRTPWSDEGQFSSAAWNLAHHGFLGTTVLESAGTGYTRIQQRTYWVMPGFLLGEALWYRLFPATLVSTRLFGILWAMVALAAFYAFLEGLLSDPRISSLATAVLALSFIFIDNAAFARPDAMCACLGFCGFAAFVRLRERSLRMALLTANTLVGASLMTHPNGILYFAGMCLMVLWLDRRRLSFAEIALSAVPYLAFLGAWLLYASRDPQAFFDQMRANGTNGRWTNTLNPVTILRREFSQRYLVAFGLVTGGLMRLKAVALAAYTVSIAAVLLTADLRRRAAVRLLLAVTALFFAIMLVFNQKLTYYLIHIVPFYIALVAVWAVWLWDAHRRLRPLVAIAVCGLIAVEAGGIFVRAATRSYLNEQRPAIDFVRAHTPSNGRIIGTAALIYELNFDPRLHDDPWLGIKTGRAPDVVVIEHLYDYCYEGWRDQRPADMQQVRQRLSTYRLAYDFGGYRIYLAPDTR